MKRCTLDAIMKHKPTPSLPEEQQVVVTHAMGLHGRPSVKLTTLAKTFKSDIRICNRSHKDWVDAKSIVRVMSLKVNSGDTVILKAVGTDAHLAIQSLVDLIQRDFE